jgi:hypothetical protein
VGKPVKHRGKWRIRWIEERGKQRSAVFDDYKRAQTTKFDPLVDGDKKDPGGRGAAHVTKLDPP